ncbi:lamin tail domain-containing protein [Patescibacteria group bacterium]|nr:lamin tail domain-containing protein [Patescibacteria group bacterium]
MNAQNQIQFYCSSLSRTIASRLLSVARRIKTFKIESITNRYTFLILIYLFCLSFFSYQVTHSYFTASATSSTNTFTAALNFPGNIVINEINWAGSTASGSADEWMELKNTTPNDINLAGWSIKGAISGSGSFPLSGTIPGNGLFLISHYNETNSAISITPDLVDSNLQLDNENAQYILKDNSGNTIDTADDDIGVPLAGSNNILKASMERNSILGDGTLGINWHTATSSVNFDPTINDKGTPKAANN